MMSFVRKHGFDVMPFVDDSVAAKLIDTVVFCVDNTIAWETFGVKIFSYA